MNNAEGTNLKTLNHIEMGRRIRSQREFLKMTREELAGQLGVSSKFVSDIEYGQKGMSIKRLYLLVQILGVSADYILAGKGNKTEDLEERRRLEESILEPLNNCNREQLKCMEQIAKYYAQGLKREQE